MKVKPIIHVTNYFSTCTISGFDVPKILKKIPYSQYRPNRFPATVIDDNIKKINLYDSGKITSTKSTTHKKAIESLYNFVDELNGIGMKCIMLDNPKITMVSAIVKYAGIINLDTLRSTTHYTKEVQSFPAIQLSFYNGVAVKVFSDKLVITGQSVGIMAQAVLYIAKYVTGD
jgi:TATA-box binding protein (TBP) (component of TFIID and TFIIIB)